MTRIDLMGGAVRPFPIKALVGHILAAMAVAILCGAAIAGTACAASGMKEVTLRLDADGNVVSKETLKQGNIVVTPPGAKHAGEQEFVYESDGNEGWKLRSGQSGTADGGNLGELAAEAYKAGLKAKSSQNAPEDAFSEAQVIELRRLFGLVGGQLEGLRGELKALTLAPQE